MLENAGHPIMLPNPDLGNLGDIENVMRGASSTAPGRDALAKFIMTPDSLYIPKLLPLVESAESQEDLPNLHKLCNIMKTLILLNDTAIIEFVVSDNAILGIVGALECMLGEVEQREAAADISQMTLTSPVTKQITDSIFRTHRSSRRWSKSKTQRFARRSTTHIAFNILRMLSWLESSTIQHFRSSIR